MTTSNIEILYTVGSFFKALLAHFEKYAEKNGHCTVVKKAAIPSLKKGSGYALKYFECEIAEFYWSAHGGTNCIVFNDFNGHEMQLKHGDIDGLCHAAVYILDAYENELRYALIGEISDLFKEVNGVRPRHFDYDNMSTSELKETAEFLSSQLQEQIAWEEETEKQNAIQFVAKLKDLKEMGAGDYRTAIRWYLQGSDIDTDEDEGYICYQLGLNQKHKGLFKQFVTQAA